MRPEKTQEQDLLILCKTYPSPSAKYIETSCVAAMNEAGILFRIYPVPFRWLKESEKFKKWQWIRARIEKTNSDKRPESYRIDVSSIQFQDKPIPTTNNWEQRRYWLNKLPMFTDFDSLETARQSKNITLALLKPKHIERLEIKLSRNANWTEEELEKLLQSQRQGHLFEQENEKNELKQLRKLPYDFYYHYKDDFSEMRKHKIVDWEAGALYWNLANKNQDWETKFRNKYEHEFAGKDLMFLMGTIHRFPDQWLIISVIYPPKLPVGEPFQESLF